MKNLTIEINVNFREQTATIWRSAPSFGESHTPRMGHVQTGVLNDGQHRVKFGVYNAPLHIETIKRLARMALIAKPE